VDVGFIGLGMMGRAMARNLGKAGHRVKAWSRSAGKHPVEGVQLVSSPAEAFQSPVVFTMLSDDAAIREVVLASNVLSAARPGAIHAVSSTISVDFAGELVARHAAAGVGYVSAPVFGRPDAAEAGQLNIVAAGPGQTLATLQPLLDAMGRKTWVIGEEPKQANAVKIAGNMMIAMAIEAMAEAVVIAGSQNVSAETFLQLMAQTLFGGRVYEGYGAKIARGDYEPGFQMKLGLKDLRLASAAAAKTGKTLPMLDAVTERMAEAVAAGMAEKDWSGIADFMQRKG
jgi:3-hydroxyisobutyrate dehydrogenase-like beta-hydroxyacid dehydrogenase